jgi:hypothetical protein
MTNEYAFLTRWRVKGTVQEIVDVLSDSADLPRWWPAVYLVAQRLKEGDEQHVGEEIRLYTKGFLPYTLRWDFRVTGVETLRSITLEAWGDFVGRGIWTFEQQGDEVLVLYDWNIRAEKPLLRRLGFVLKPVFAANHRWAMHTGEQSLRLELERRRARTAEERQRIPPPPPATPTSFLAWTAMTFGQLFRRLESLLPGMPGPRRASG